MGGGWGMVGGWLGVGVVIHGAQPSHCQELAAKDAASASRGEEDGDAAAKPAAVPLL